MLCFVITNSILFNVFFVFGSDFRIHEAETRVRKMQENKKSSSIPTRAKTAGGLVGSTFLSLGHSSLIGMEKLSRLRE